MSPWQTKGDNAASLQEMEQVNTSQVVLCMLIGNQEMARAFVNRFGLTLHTGAFTIIHLRKWGQLQPATTDSSGNKKKGK